MKYIHLEINSSLFVNPNTIKDLKHYYSLDKDSNSLNYYIRFTSINKVGFHPDSDYSNIIGVYCYPLALILKDFLKRKLPCEDRPFIHLLEKRNIRVLDNTNYTSSDYQKDLVNLEKIYNSEKKDISKIEKDTYDRYVFSKYIKNPCFSSLVSCLPTYYSANGIRKGKSNVAQNIYFLSNLVATLSTSNNITVKWNAIMRKLGFELLVDRGKGWIYPNSGEKIQSVFLSAKGYNLVETYQNPYS